MRTYVLEVAVDNSLSHEVTPTEKPGVVKPSEIAERVILAQLNAMTERVTGVKGAAKYETINIAGCTIRGRESWPSWIITLPDEVTMSDEEFLRKMNTLTDRGEFNVLITTLAVVSKPLGNRTELLGTYYERMPDGGAPQGPGEVGQALQELLNAVVKEMSATSAEEEMEKRYPTLLCVLRDPGRVDREPHGVGDVLHELTKFVKDQVEYNLSNVGTIAAQAQTAGTATEAITDLRGRVEMLEQAVVCMIERAEALKAQTPGGAPERGGEGE